MAQLQDVKDALAAVSAKLDAERTEVLDAINALKAQVAAGTAVSPADLDDLLASVGALGTKVEGVITDGDK